jgi:predicted transcriptional regulator
MKICWRDTQQKSGKKIQKRIPESKDIKNSTIE